VFQKGRKSGGVVKAHEAEDGSQGDMMSGNDFWQHSSMLGIGLNVF